MTTNYDIVIRVSEQNLKLFGVAADQVTKVGDAVTSTDAKMKSAGGGADAFAQKLDAAGTKARVGLSSVSQLASAAGVNLSGIVGPAASAADAVGDLASSFGSLGLAGVAIGGIVTAMILLKKHYDDFISARAKAIQQSDAYLKSLQDEARVNDEVAKAIDRVATARAKADVIHRGGGRAADATGAVTQSLNQEVTQAEQSLWRLTAASGGAGDALKTLAGHTEAAAQAGRDYNAELARSIELTAGQTNAAASMAQAERTADGWMGRLGVSTKATGDMAQRAKAYTDDLNASTLRLAEEGLQKARAAAERLRSAFQGVVESALQPTEAKLGPDTWDETRKRLEAVATGTNPAQYGDKFQAQLGQLEKLGYTAETAAKAFKDFSLFADPKNLDLVDWGPFVTDVSHQIDIVIGRANLMREGFQKAWDALSPQKKADLAKALDVDPNSATAAKEVFDAMQGGKADAAAETTGKIATNVKVIEGLHTMTLQLRADEAKTAIEDFYNNWLKKYILDNANISINVSANVSTSETGAGSKDGIPGRATGGYASEGIYRLGEGKKEEYVLDARITKWIESVLGHRITSPNEIAWLISALHAGKEETLNQMALFASGRTNHAVPIPEGASKWLDDVYKSYALAHGFDSLPTDVQRSMAGGGGGGGGAGGGTGDSPQVVALLTSIDNKLGALLTAAGVSLQAPVSGKMPRLLNVDREVRMLAAMGVG